VDRAGRAEADSDDSAGLKIFEFDVSGHQLLPVGRGRYTGSQELVGMALTRIRAWRRWAELPPTEAEPSTHTQLPE
jgi:hypothetical protein